MTKEQSGRPAGCSLLAILYGLRGLLWIGLAFLGGLAGILLSTFDVPMQEGSFEVAPFMIFGGPVGIIGGALIGAFGLLCIFYGLFDFVKCYAVWNMKKWGWWIIIIWNILLILSTLLINILGIIIPLIVILYLYSAREHFV